MRKNYPATNAGLRRMGRDMQKEIEKGMRPVRVPVRYDYTLTETPPVSQPGEPPATTVNNNHYGDVVSIGGNNNLVAVGNHGPVHQNGEQADTEWRMAMLSALGNIQSRLDELDLDQDDHDTVEDAAVSAAAIASDHGGTHSDKQAKDTALRRRGRKVLDVLEKVMTSAGGGLLVHELAGPLQNLI